MRKTRGKKEVLDRVHLGSSTQHVTKECREVEGRPTLIIDLRTRVVVRVGNFVDFGLLVRI